MSEFHTGEPSPNEQLKERLDQMFAENQRLIVYRDIFPGLSYQQLHFLTYQQPHEADDLNDTTVHVPGFYSSHVAEKTNIGYTLSDDKDAEIFAAPTAAEEKYLREGRDWRSVVLYLGDGDTLTEPRHEASRTEGGTRRVAVTDLRDNSVYIEEWLGRVNNEHTRPYNPLTHGILRQPVAARNQPRKGDDRIATHKEIIDHKYAVRLGQLPLWKQVIARITAQSL